MRSESIEEMTFRPELLDVTEADAVTLAAKVVDMETGKVIAFCETFAQADFICEALTSYSGNK